MTTKRSRRKKPRITLTQLKELAAVLGGIGGLLAGVAAAIRLWVGK